MMAIPNIQMAAQQAIMDAANTTAAASKTVASAVTGANPSTAAYPTPFANLFQDAVQKTQQLESNAATTVTGLLSGQGVDVHTAMIATEKSDLGFEMMLAFRNKAVSAYQQLMQMQF
ncbi:MAG TPA: flagellar hook-basal body complex protein FliE [Acidobacteriaceae bacterium]|nr:flagellar hook-basal body complex protein FliE [Acidobacteriaceae bacterium]